MKVVIKKFEYIINLMGSYSRAVHTMGNVIKTDRFASFFRATNAIFGKIGRAASEEVVLELVKCKCLPILLYGLECCPLNKSDVKSLDFAVTRFLMKLFKSVNLDLINECRFWFNFSLPSELLEKRIAKFQKRYEGIGHIIRYFGKNFRNSHSTHVKSEMRT